VRLWRATGREIIAGGRDIVQQPRDRREKSVPLGRISAVSAAGLRTLFTYFLTDDEPDSPFCVMRPLV